MGQRSVRFPDELVARAEAWCAEHDRPFSYVAVKALEAFLGPEESVVVRAQAGEFERSGSSVPLVTPRAFNIPPGSLKERWLEPEPSSGCPECGGDLKPVEGESYRMCAECHALSS